MNPVGLGAKRVLIVFDIFVPSRKEAFPKDASE